MERRLWHYPKLVFDATINRRWDSSGDDKSSAEQGIQAAGQQAYARSQATPEELSQYKGSFDIGNILKQIMEYQQGIGQAPAGYQTGEQQYQAQGPLAKSYYDVTMKGVTDPYTAYESQLQPGLQQAQDYINRNASQRGLLRSGIPIEQMGRAGVDLAIKEAQDRMNFRQQGLNSAGQLSQYSNQLGQQSLQNLYGLYGSQQQYGQGAMNRQATAATNAAQYQAAPYTAQLGNYYGSQGNTGAGIGGAAGTLLGAGLGYALAPATLGTSMLAAPVAGALLGGGLGGVTGSQLGRSIF